MKFSAIAYFDPRASLIETGLDRITFTNTLHITQCYEKIGIWKNFAINISHQKSMKNNIPAALSEHAKFG